MAYQFKGKTGRGTVGRWSDVRRFVLIATMAAAMLHGTAAWAFPPVKPAEIDAHRQALCNEGGASAEEFDAIASVYLKELEDLDAATDVFQRWSNAPAVVLELGLYEDLYATDSYTITRLWRHQRARLTTRYFDRLGSLQGVSDDVVDGLKRTHLRHVYLHQDETPDLTALVDAIVTDPTQRELIAEVLAGWEQAVHPLLLDRTTPEGIERHYKFRIAREERDAERMEALLTKMNLSTAAPRELTQRSLDRIIRLLPAVTGRRLRDRADRILYKSLYASMAVDHALTAALERTDLSPSQRRQLDAIVTSLDRRRHDQREDLKKRIDFLAGTESARRRAAHVAGRIAGTIEQSRIDESLEYSEHWKSFVAIGAELREQIQAVVGDG